MFQGRVAREEVTISLAVLFASVAIPAIAYGFAGGTGQLNDPYRIATASELKSIGSDPNLLSRCFVLVADIDLAGQVFSRAVIAPDTETTAGFDRAVFTGSFDGQGYKVTNLTIDVSPSESGYLLGLFGHVGDGGWVTNLGVECMIVCSGRHAAYVGGLAGASNGLINRCYTEGSISCGDWAEDIGGLVGSNTGTITQCYTSANTSIGQHGSVGGLAGSNGGVIHQCYVANAHLSIGMYSDLAGLVVSNTGVISQCYTTAVASRQMFSTLGGLVLSNTGHIEQCYFLSPIDGGGTDNGLGIALSSQGMKQGESLAGWDLCSVDTPAGAWLVPDQDYPVLAWQTEASDLVWLPRVRGTTLTDAQDMLAEVGLVFGSVLYDFDITVPADRVIALNPRYPVAEGTVVDVLISLGAYDWNQNAGNGSITEPYEISSAGQLECMGQDRQLWDSRFLLTADIDLTGRVYPAAVIASYPNEDDLGFGGTLDGRGYSIIGLTIASAGDYVGLFGHLSGNGEVRGLILQDAHVLGRSTLNGAGGTGVVAGSSDGLVRDCSASGSATGERQVGGLVGLNRGRILRCDVAVRASGNLRVGGLVGYFSSSAPISQCFSTGDVSGNDALGGLVGLAAGPITWCFATGNISGRENLGGLVGYAFSRTSAYECFATGNVAGDRILGGFVGASDGAIVDRCYATGSVSGTACLGGLAGDTAGEISECYSTGAVIGAENCGGLAGTSSSDVVASFWNVESSGLPHSEGGTGLTTAQMQTAAPFIDAGWDFASTWMICEASDYPHLQWEAVYCSGQ